MQLLGFNLNVRFLKKGRFKDLSFLFLYFNVFLILVFRFHYCFLLLCNLLYNYLKKMLEVFQKL